MGWRRWWLGAAKIQPRLREPTTGVAVFDVEGKSERPRQIGRQLGGGLLLKLLAERQLIG